MGSRVAVLGASGFAGAELLRLLARHPGMEVVAASASTRVGMRVTDLYPGFEPYSGLSFVTVEEAIDARPDLIFSSLPHAQSMILFGQKQEHPLIVDLAGDFRLKDAALYPRWYGAEHSYPEALDGWVYGLTEFHRDEIRAATRVANPGCYPAAALLALLPLVTESVIDTESIHVDAKSGVSGAGRAGGEGFDFSSANENTRPYGVTGHKHIPEIEQELSRAASGDVKITFVPHLVPMIRGIVATCVAHSTKRVTTEDLIGIYESRYATERFLRVLGPDDLPETKRIAGTNLAEVTARVDERTQRVIAIAAIDNLGKGAAGQAIQNANLMCGFEEAAGLDQIGLVP